MVQYMRMRICSLMLKSNEAFLCQNHSVPPRPAGRGEVLIEKL